MFPPKMFRKCFVSSELFDLKENKSGTKIKQRQIEKFIFSLIEEREKETKVERDRQTDRQRKKDLKTLRMREVCAR